MNGIQPSQSGGYDETLVELVKEAFYFFQAD
jgi:hypothetical protein